MPDCAPENETAYYCEIREDKQYFSFNYEFALILQLISCQEPDLDYALYLR